MMMLMQMQQQGKFPMNAAQSPGAMSSMQMIQPPASFAGTMRSGHMAGPQGTFKQVRLVCCTHGAELEPPSAFVSLASCSALDYKRLLVPYPKRSRDGPNSIAMHQQVSILVNF